MIFDENFKNDQIEYLNKKVYQLIQTQAIIFSDSNMSQQPNTKRNVSPSIYETPLKNSSNQRLLLTNDESYEKSNQKIVLTTNSFSVPNQMTMNIFKKKKFAKTIKKVNFKLLIQQSLKLNRMKTQADFSSDVSKQYYTNELDKVYFVLGRIEKIHEDRKYYNIFCQDDTKKSFKLYFLKHKEDQNSAKKFFISGIQNRRITSLDNLDFESREGEGTPYFKFFVIFREIPIFEIDQKQILNSEEQFSDTDQEESSVRKLYKQKVKSTEFRIYVEHFEKVENFNYVTYHNMQIFTEEMYRKKVIAQKIDFFDNDC